jgi:hypothetical protein
MNYPALPGAKQMKAVARGQLDFTTQAQRVWGFEISNGFAEIIPTYSSSGFSDEKVTSTPNSYML